LKILSSRFPPANPFFTFQWDYSVNINTFQDKSTEKKRSRGSFMQDYMDDSDSNETMPPLRRSRRIAQRRQAGASSSHRADRN
jgi:hypothetical protein